MNHKICCTTSVAKNLGLFSLSCPVCGVRVIRCMASLVSHSEIWTYQNQEQHCATKAVRAVSPIGEKIEIFNNKPFHFGFYENRNWESCHFRSLNGRFCSVSDFTLLLFKSPFSFILTISILSRPFHLRLLTSSSPTHVPVNTQHFHCLNLWPCPTPDLHPHSHCILSKPINLKP